MKDRLFPYINRFLMFGVTTVTVALLVVAVVIFTVSMDVSVEGRGHLRPKLLEKIKAPVTGKIRRVYVLDNQRITEGDTLLVFDTREDRERLQEARADVSILKVEIGIAEREYDRMRRALNIETNLYHAELDEQLLRVSQKKREWEADKAVGDSLVAEPFDLQLARAQSQKAQIQCDKAEQRAEELEEILLRIQQKKLELEKRRTTIDQLEARIGEAVVLAPAAGTIIGQDVQELSGNHVTAGEVMFEIASSGYWTMRAYFSDKTLPFIRAGQTAKIFLDAFPYLSYRIFAGTVADFSLQPNSQSERNQYLVEIELQERDLDHLAAQALSLNGLRGRVKLIIRHETIARHVWNYLLQNSTRLQISNSA